MQKISSRVDLIQPGQFEPERHWYPKALNATIHPLVSFFLNLKKDRIINRYCHLHPRVKPEVLKSILDYKPKYFIWAGADLMHVTDEEGRRQMVVIENNSCPFRSGLTGIHNTLIYLGMADGDIEEPDAPPIICDHSYWIYTNRGGVLQVLPNVTDLVQKGERIAIMRNIFGDTIKEYVAPEDGIIIGKSTHPIAQTGSRVVHLGILK